MTSLVRLSCVIRLVILIQQGIQIIIIIVIVMIIITITIVIRL